MIDFEKIEGFDWDADNERESADKHQVRNHKTIKYRIGIARDTGWGACDNDAG